MKNKVTMIEIFSGIGAQEKALAQFKIPYEVIATMDVDKDAVLSYAAMRCDFEKELRQYNFPPKEQMINELQSKNVGFDFVKNKHTITMSTNIEKVKQYYLADKLSRNLGDVSLCKELPYADIVFHSSPCQDFSQSGKGAGGDEGSGTRSSLMFESLRLIGTSQPKYVVWENVAAVLNDKHKHNFIKYLERLSDMGYESAFDLLNAKDYGIPQNRLRIFCVSRKNENHQNAPYIYNGKSKKVTDILKDISDNPNIKLWSEFQFPTPIPLTTRLKDFLEKNVDEKYYLPDERVDKILQNWAERDDTAVYDKINVVGNYMPSNHDASRVVNINGITPAVKENHGTVTAIAEPQLIKVGQIESSYEQSGRIYSSQGISPTIMSNSHGKTTGGYTSPKIAVEEIDPFIVASRGRNPNNPSDRTVGSPTEQRFEPNLSGTTNCLTSVVKDNYVCEPKLEFVGGIGDKDWAKDGKKLSRNYPQGSRIYSANGIATALTAQGVGGMGGYSGLYTVPEPIVYDDYNSRISADQEAINTLTTNCGASAERSGVKILEPSIVDDIYNSRPARIYDDTAPTLRSERSGLKVAEWLKWRIRKLTEKEAWRLMGFSDRDCERAAQYIGTTARYKQAGNSICTCCLVAIFNALLFENYTDAYKDKLVKFDE